MQTKDQQKRWQTAEVKEIHPTESCQVTPGDWGEERAPFGEQKAPCALHTDVLVSVGGCALELAHTQSPCVTGGPGSWSQSVLQVLFTERSLWVSWGQQGTRVR